MKNTKFTAIALVIITFLSGCHKPDELIPSVSRSGINSITATFSDGTGQFSGYITDNST
jgi:hypothetical protein